MTPTTLVDALVRAASLPEQRVLRLLDRRERPTTLTWAEVHRRAAAVAGRLLAAGVERGDRVALVFPTGAAFFDAFFGTLLAGAVPVPLYPPVRLGRLGEYHHRTATMIRAAGARLVLAGPRVHGLLGETALRARPPLGVLRLADLPDAPPAGFPAGEEELALVQFSSGTTVDPKPVALSHRALLAQAEAIRKAIMTAWPEGGGFRHAGVSWLPLYHDMGLIGCVAPAVLHPGDLTLLGPEVFVARPASWLRAISSWGGTVSPAPNFAYALCVERIRDEELEGVDLSGWRIAMNGAEPVAPETLRTFVRRFARWGLRPEALTPVYGLSEAALAVTFSDLRRPFRSVSFSREALAREGVARPRPPGAPDDSERWTELVSVGRPVPGFRIAIRDAEGCELPEGRVGRVHAAGPSLMTGYLGRPEATGRAIRDGWLDTGDLGFLHEGELYLVGRARDVLILRGRNHAPQDVEQAVDGVPGVRRGCAAAVSHRPEGAPTERLLLFVEHARDARSAVLAELEQACLDAVLAATGLRCDEVHVLPPGTLPRTSSGKIRRAETLRRHLAGELEPPHPAGPAALLGAWLRSRRAMARARREA